MDDNLSSAIVLYLGYGRESFPHQRREAVQDRFGVEATAVLGRLDAVLRVLDGVAPRADEELSAAARRAVAVVRAAHPELTEEALSALGWGYSYWWK